MQSFNLRLQLPQRDEPQLRRLIELGRDVLERRLPDFGQFVELIHRRAGEPTDELPDLPHLDGRPAYEELAFLTDTLPPRERAAVVLRYGYDLDYDQIAAALDSTEEAARQAASSGVRRLRRRIT